MSELKVVKQSDVIWGHWFTEYYLKSEADKVIAEKDKEIAEKDDKVLQYKVLYKELCRDINTQERFFALKIAHNKYKRCLAMAKWCRIHDEFTQLASDRLGLPQRTLFIEYRRKAMWWNKWHKRWLEFAEKFKEAK